MPLKYKRVLLKVSGEAFASEGAGAGIDLKIVNSVAVQIKAIHDLGAELAVVVGGGNLFRGQAASQIGMERATADYIGMLGTVMNGIALQDAFERNGVHTRVLSAITMQEVAEPYIRRRAMRHLEKGRVVIFAAGTGNPYFSTDTAAALRALETGCEVIMKATKVDGVYDKDPEKDPAAVKFNRLTYLEALSKELGVMDATAFSLCKDNDIPIVVFNLLQEGNLLRVMQGEDIGTTVSN